ncbi:MSMEG_1061 family FMN-dependent PPOX-type flavoprotein [Rhodovulum sp. DZ06]|uniref:MSMEG_1061 family FMN-dependent PPOX-type flavoprotein n=1 Tax=Rhodovulum sp. DZ06 TaxID=3425126 RepID=UPI003D3304A2
MARITDRDALRARYGTVSARAANKQVDRIDDHVRLFLARSPMMFMATSDGARVDVSPRGDRPGFVQAEDDAHVLVPDRPGNNRLDGLENILANPHVGLIFVIPAEGWTLRINGPAEIRDDAALLARFEAEGRRPATVLRVRAEEIFLHCPRAFQRAGLWRPEEWPAKAARPDIGQMLRAHAELAEAVDIEALNETLKKGLY